MKRILTASWLGLFAAAVPALGAVSVVPARIAPAPLGGLAPLRLSLESRGQFEALAIVERLAYADPATGLPNRAFLLERGAQALEGVADPAVAMLDVDHFKAVNQGLADARGVRKGRARADAALAIAGGALGELARAAGVTAVRIGGDEFAVLGARENVLAFAGAVRRALPPGRLLDAAGISRDAAESRAIEAAMSRLGVSGEPAGDFTFGVAALRGRSLAEGLKAADGALVAAKSRGLRGAILVEDERGEPRAWEAPAPDLPAPSLRLPEPARTADDALRLEGLLTPRERGLFRARAFVDPLTGARTLDFVRARAASWDRTYSGGGGRAALLSARRLKTINDRSGHDAGDAYLRRLGAILAQEIREARASGLDVQEPARVLSKEFLLVGRDAGEVARRVASAAERTEGGGVISVVEPLEVPGGRADVLAAFDRAVEGLERRKSVEDRRRASVSAARSRRQPARTHARSSAERRSSAVALR